MTRITAIILATIVLTAAAPARATAYHATLSATVDPTALTSCDTVDLLGNPITLTGDVRAIDFTTDTHGRGYVVHVEVMTPDWGLQVGGEALPISHGIVTIHGCAPYGYNILAWVAPGDQQYVQYSAPIKFSVQ